MKRFLILMFSPLFCFSELSTQFLPQVKKELEREMVINNRILTKVNGKAISLLDVVKEMDVYLNRYYPQMAESQEGRYQFYMATWKDLLEQMVTSELMMADAESREIKVTDGEIRELIQERFGPNVMSSLARVGLSYEEARDMVHREMIVERMRWFRVTSKAQHQVNLQDIKKAYQTYCVEHPSKNVWGYQILTVRAEEKELGKFVAEAVYQWIALEKNPLDQVLVSFQEKFPQVQVTLSQEYEFEDKNLSDFNREALSSISVGEITTPIEQKSRDNALVYRLFVLKKHIQEPAPRFEAVVNEIKEELLQKAVAKELSLYLAKLRSRFGYSDTNKEIPADYKPFVLR